MSEIQAYDQYASVIALSCFLKLHSGEGSLVANGKDGDLLCAPTTQMVFRHI